MYLYKIISFEIILCLSIIFLNCASSKNNLPQDTVSTDENWVAPPRIKPPPSPGTVKAIAEIVDIVHEGKQSLVTVRIQKVLGYGSATPLLSIGREIKTVLSPSLQEKMKASDSNTLIQERTVIITLNNLNDRVVFWVLFPGTLGGIAIISLGIFLLKYIKKTEEKKKLVSIIKKLLNKHQLTLC